MSVLVQRPLRGSRISSFYPIKVLPSLSSLDSAFQLQEYISLLIRLDVHDVDAIVSVPGKSSDGTVSPEEPSATENTGKGKEPERISESEKDADKTKSDVAVDEACWIYEQLRRLAQDLSHPLITMLQQECTRRSCPEMKAGEWLYLCVAHGNNGAMEQCCAIDYILHTLDSATALLNSPRAFPSRLQIPQTSHRHFSSLARRLGRIFAHAYFHHREAFEQAEAESSLYARFLALTSKFDLVPAEFLVIPPRMEGGEGDALPPRLMAAAVDMQGDREREQQENNSVGPMKILTRAKDANSSSSDRDKSASPPGLGSESPRKQQGRSRTDTMVHSDMNAYNHMNLEELARNETDTSSETQDKSAHDDSGSTTKTSFADVPEDENEDDNAGDEAEGGRNIVESLRLNFEGVDGVVEDDAELSILQREGSLDTPIPGSVFESHEEDLPMESTSAPLNWVAGEDENDLVDMESSAIEGPQTIPIIDVPAPVPTVSLPTPPTENEEPVEPATSAADESGDISVDINDVSLGEMQAVEDAVLRGVDATDGDSDDEEEKPAIDVALVAGKKDVGSLDVPSEVGPVSPVEADVTEAHNLSDSDEETVKK